MDRANYAEPILRARAALQTAERLLMDGKHDRAEYFCEVAAAHAEQLADVCRQMAREQAQRDA